MKNTEKYGRFSSCRGVAFEIKPHADLFAIPAPVTNPPRNSGSRRSWVQWTTSFSRIVPSSDLLERSLSRSSSHFCDLDDDDDDEVETLADIEEGHDEGKPDQSPPPNLLLPRPFSRSDQPPPPSAAKKKSASSRLSVILLDQGLFTVYKRLFVVVLALNITGLVLAATGDFPYARNRAALFSIANIFALVLCRSEAVLRVVFWVAVNVLGYSWVPLLLKTMTTALLQSLGGIHSGCGISSAAWLIYALVLTLKDRDNTSPEIIGVASAILGLLCLSSLAAFPLVRHLHHNVFERTHRFAGWSALGLLWAFITLTISYDPLTKTYSSDLRSRLVKRQEFWFTIGITVLIIIPWLTVRRVPVRVSSPSGHAAIIKFHGGVKAGILGRISPSPLSEWHAFGIISDNKKEHMMLAGAVGDFTRSLVASPPRHLWVRQVHFAGLPYLTNMYSRVLLVATGSGICVFLSFLLQPCKADVCLLWVTKGVEQNFGKEIKEWISGHPKEKVIVHDTAVLGRPNVSQMSVDAAKKFGAEVVIVTSNPEGSRDVVDACKSAGIAAFGPIWDS
ncbi:adenylate-forming reductase 03009-like [Salvia miltiorrhiza]|uniref:adenylate-forming reductase 03009-like n=1 Tax=Salvia miltiorrhiza TaxID=226208 RepID=UPI0025ACE19E|nr:adenylate-forming reductase 03009-like [Salvia miltiorrhiza]